MMRLGRTVLALVEPVDELLAEIESAPDEALAPGAPVAPPSTSIDSGTSDSPAAAYEEADEVRSDNAAQPSSPPRAEEAPRAPQKARTVWSIMDFIVMSAALGLLILSIAGLAWLLRG
jgi:hypothetical protein